MHLGERPEAGQQRLLTTLERLLTIQALEVKEALAEASQLVAEALDAEKVDAFLYEPAIDSLVAVGSSDTPMARLQHRLGLASVPVANGGYAVEVYLTGESYRTGQADQDPLVAVGVWQRLGVRSIVAVPLIVGGERRGVVEVASNKPDHFSPEDLRFAEAVARWVGMVAQQAELVEHLARDAAVRARRMAAEELIAVLAHDLRTPLTAATGYLSLLRRRALREGRQQEVGYFDQMGRALQRLSDMIGALMDAGRLEQGLFELELQPVDLARLVRETVDTLATPGTPIRVTGPEELVIEQADPERLRQALENLIGNAIEHSPEGASVIVELDQEARQDGVWAVLCVRDAGPGIPPALLPTLFDRFARGATSSGLGLGLYLARGIAEAHGGTLTVESQLGAGSSFCLAMPLVGPQAP